jgi:hypothetical protein
MPNLGCPILFLQGFGRSEKKNQKIEKEGLGLLS